MKRIIALLLAMLMLGTLYTGALAAEMTDGVYVGQGKGFGGNIEVTVTIEGGKITAVEPGAHQETAGISRRRLCAAAPGHHRRPERRGGRRQRLHLLL